MLTKHSLARCVATAKAPARVLGAAVMLAATIAPLVQATEQYQRTVFDDMPHAKILELQRKQCADDAVARGLPAASATCLASVEKAYGMLVKVNEVREMPDTTWRLCVGQAQTPAAYDYPELLRCMKAAYFICQMRPDGEYVDKGQCIRIIQSGAWRNHPKAQ